MAEFQLLALEVLTPTTAQPRVPAAGDSYVLPLDLKTVTGVINSGVADGATANAFVLNSVNALATTGSNILSLQNNLVDKVKFSKDGDLWLAQASNITIGSGGTSIISGPALIFLKPAQINFCNSTNLSLKKTGFTLGRMTSQAFTIEPQSGVSDADQNANAFTVKGADAYASASINLSGGHLHIKGGAGASGSAALANGGDVVLSGGDGFGTGTYGYVILNNLPTFAPSTPNAIWRNGTAINIT